jgi:hypothetical protein
VPLAASALGVIVAIAAVVAGRRSRLSRIG